MEYYDHQKKRKRDQIIERYTLDSGKRKSRRKMKRRYVKERRYMKRVLHCDQIKGVYMIKKNI